jgi:hypothetical protein
MNTTMGAIPAFRGPTLVCTAWSSCTDGGPRFEPVADTTLPQEVLLVYEPSR